MIAPNLDDSVIVFDLDDTLYPEIQYLKSGISYVLNYISPLYPSQSKKLSSFSLTDLSSTPFDDIVSCLGLPASVVTSLLWLYRNHTPSIRLHPSTSLVLDWSYSNFRAVCIVTDGRSVTQRLKLFSLGLSSLPAYISEEFMDQKPSPLRFRQIMKDHPANNYIYVGDNPLKDFLAPNQLKWITIGLRASPLNIHPQPLSLPTLEYHPSFWIDTLSDLVNVFDHD